MLAAVRVGGEQEQRAARGEHESHADDRFLHVGPAPVGPREQERARERGQKRAGLHRPALRLETDPVGEHDAKPGDLRDRKIDEYDPALQAPGCRAARGSR